MTSRASLNHTFRTVWNQALGAMVAVAEIASGAGKGSGAGASACAGAAALSRAGAAHSLPAVPLGALALGVALACASMAPALANPTGAVAVVGQAALSNPGANQLLVTTQNGAGQNHSVINWQSFSIPAGSATYFAQPSASSTSINRVVTDNPSAIFGSLGSNGKLVLVNPSGITVGAGAVVDTAGFTASALAMSDADALAGRLRFGNGQAGSGSIDVQGSILARSGDVVLIAPQINTGKDALIQANGATVLAAGRQVDITGRGLEGIVLQVQAPSDQAVNLGTLQGDAVGIFAGTLKHSGAIQANALSVEGGKVVLKAVDMADVSGSIQAKKSQGLGGDVLVTADKTVLRETASMDTSNTGSGGTIHIGGGWHGDDASISNARRTVVMPGASLKADATEQGNGGTVVVWADQATGFGGTISAKGGANGGDGGKVEVSGKQYLDFQGVVDTSAPKGKAGSLLLDPANLTVGLVNDLNGNGTPNEAADLLSGLLLLATDFPGANSIITNTALNLQLALGNVSLAATGSITVGQPLTSSGNGLTLTAQTGSIALNDTVNLGSGNLSLHAGTTITQSAAITAGNLDVTAGGAVSLGNSGNNFSGGVAAQVSGSFAYFNTGEITIDVLGGINGLQLGGSFSLNSSTGGVVQRAPIVAAGAGSISVNSGPDVVLDNAGNNFSQLTIGAAANVTIVNPHPLTLNGVTGTSLNLNTSGGNGSITGNNIDITGGNLRINAGSGAVSLTTTSSCNCAFDVYDITAGSLTLRLSSDSRLNGAITTSTGGVDISTPSGYINLTSGYGSIVSAAGIALHSNFYLGVNSATLQANNGDVVLRTDNDLFTSSPSIIMPNGRMLVYVGNGGHVYQLGNLPALAFKQYNTTFGGTILGSGNGLVYNTGPNGVAATLTGTLTGAVSKVYDGSTSIGLTGASVGSVSSNVAGDTATVSLTGATGTLSDPNVGNNKLVSVSNATVTAHDANGLPIYGYSLAGLSGNIGTVRPVIPIISLSGERFYDGTNIVNASIFTLSGLVNGETLTLSGAGTVADKNAGVNKVVNLGSLTLGNGSGQASNYTFDGGTFVATIIPLTVSSVTGLTAANKVYDGTTKATINTSNAVLSGILSGDNVSVLSATGTFADKNAGVGKTVAISNLNFGGADAQNYKFQATSASTTADISKATISAIGPIAVNNKVYDGTTSATLASSPPALTGAIAGDDLRISVGSASFADKNAGNAKTVNLSGIALAGTDAGNYTLNAPTSATSSATISKATLSGVAGITGVDKTYDGTTVANIDASKQALTGAVAGDNLTLSGILASFADKNAGANKTINLSGFALAGSDAANYTLSFSSATTSATINQAVLQLSGISVADKVYDGTTDATITTANAKLGGIIGNDNVSLAGFGKAVFASKNVGTQAVNINDLKLSGTDAANYALTGNAAAASATITQRPLSTWTGAAGGNWSNPANWDAIPDGTNVLAVSIPAGSGSIVFDTSASLQSLTSARPLVLAGGSLNVANAINLGSYSQSAGSLVGGAGMTVTSSFSQSGGSISLSGPLSATQASGALQAGTISAPAITLTASNGAISQSGAFSTASLSTSANGGISLTAAGNKISSISASNAGSGDISLVNGVPLNINGMSNSAGNVSVDNTGGVVTGQQTVTASGKITIAAHSPLTIGSGGVQAGGDIVLTAGASSGQDDLVINGPISSSGGNVQLNAGDNLQQNANVNAPAGSVTASVAGLISGAGVATGKDVNYSSGGVTVPPPGSASVQVIQTLVSSFSDSFNDSTAPGSTGSGATGGAGTTQDPAASKDKKKDDLVVAADSNVCK